MSERALSALASLVLLAAAPLTSEAQVYGYTDENGVLILSNVPSDDRMRMIAEPGAEEAGTVWRYSGQYDDLILKASRLFGVDSSLVRAVIAVESAFNRYARSHKGARGLMQLMPDTGRRYGLVNPYDPWQNIRAGTAHLRDLLDEFDDLRLALAAYNAGATPVRRYRSIPPYRETRDYVRRVMSIYQAGGKIEIVKGGKLYRIGQPGGEARVTEYRPPADGTGGSRLAALARRSAAARTPLPPERRAQPEAGAIESEPAGNVYYRYVDPEGVVYITRNRPAAYPYDILEP